MGSNHLEYRTKVYDLLLKGNKTSTEIARLMACDRQIVSNQLRRLKEHGMVRTIGFHKSTPLWSVVKNPKPVVRDGFKSCNFDRTKFKEAIKGTPWQGMEHL